MTTAVISFRTGRAVAPDHVAMLTDILSRDGCRCAFCRAPGGASVLYGAIGHREVYVLLDTLEAFDAVSGEAMGVVPADILPIGISTRTVLDVAFLDHDPGNVGRRGRHSNVVTLCQSCGTRHADAALFQRRCGDEKSRLELNQPANGPWFCNDLPLATPRPIRSAWRETSLPCSMN
jgi:hypothetical protein